MQDEVLGLAVKAGAEGHRLISGMHHVIAALAMTGSNVLADHVLVEPRWLEECALRIKERLESGIPPTTFRIIRQLNR